MPELYRVRVTKDHLVFSAAHFITFGGNICERLHGHNWRVAAEVSGPLDDNAYVYDFIALRDGLQKIVQELDHRLLLPTRHRQIHVSASASEVEARFEDRRWIVPREDAVLLPLENTTAERLAWWIAQRWLADQSPQARAAIAAVAIDVEENFGQWAQVTLTGPELQSPVSWNTP